MPTTLSAITSPLVFTMINQHAIWAANPVAITLVVLVGFYGVFHLYKDEEILVRINFTWKDDGSFENKSVLEFAGQKVSGDFTITADKEGYWTKIEGSSRIGTLVDCIDRKPGPCQSLFENLGDPAFILDDQQAHIIPG